LSAVTRSPVTSIPPLILIEASTRTRTSDPFGLKILRSSQRRTPLETPYDPIQEQLLMYAMRTFVYPQGTRVRVRRGRFPMAKELLAREGTVVFLDDYRPGRYGVVLDDEQDRRDFSEDELEALH